MNRHGYSKNYEQYSGRHEGKRVILALSNENRKKLFAIVISAVVLSLNYLPSVPLVHANAAPNEPWYPAGPSMDKLQYTVFSDGATELTNLLSATPSIDLTDSPCSPSACPAGPSYYVTSPVRDSGYGELEFHLGQNFWGCDMNFGNSACGVDIRQAFAHGLQKSLFVNSAQIAIDNPVPPGETLGSPTDQNKWDGLFSEPGGSPAYYLGPDAACGLLSCASTPTFTFTPGLGTADFCAAAGHLVHAGLATGMTGGTGTGTCQLTGVQPIVTTRTIQLFADSADSSLLNMGVGYAQFICALFTGAFTTGCSPYLTFTSGPPGAFPGYLTSVSSMERAWWVYTAYVKNVNTPDQSLYFRYDSRFVSGTPDVKASCLSSSVTSFSASNYIYLCNPGYDTQATAGEFDATLAAAATDFTAAQDTFGQNAFAIPVYSNNNQYAYLSNWQRVINAGSLTTVGSGIPNFFTPLNAYSPTASTPGTIRQGLKTSPDSLNPYYARSSEDWNVLYNIYDTLYKVNPNNFGQLIDWMTVNHFVLTNSQLGYSNPPPGTVVSIRNTLRNDIFWHDGTQVTSWDVAFSFLSLMQSGSFVGTPALGSVLGVTVLSPLQFDINLAAMGIYDPLSLASIPILPGHIFSQQCYGAAWNFGGSGKTEPIIYDADALARVPDVGYQPAAGDFVVAQPTGANAIPAGTPINSDPHIMYYDWHGDGRYADTSSPITTTTPWTWVYTGGPNAGTVGTTSIGIDPVIFHPGTGAAWTAATDTVLNLYSSPPIYLFTTPTPVNQPWDKIVAGADPPLPPNYTLSTDGHLMYVGPPGGYALPNLGASNASHQTYTPGSGCMTAWPAVESPTYDPLASPPSFAPQLSGTLVGSGPWVCTSSGKVGGGCSTTGTQLQPAGDSYTLQRFGFGTSPAGPEQNTYFRSNGNLALWIWSQMRGDFTQDFLTFTEMIACYNLPAGQGTTCPHWQEGIGNPLPPAVRGSPITIAQVGIMVRYVGIGWVAPFDWVNNPPVNVVSIASSDPVLYEGSNTLNPETAPGWGCVLPQNGPFSPNAYPNANGGYDC